MKFRQARTIGGKGRGPGQIAKALRGISADAEGRLYVAADEKLCVFDSAGKLETHWRTDKPAWCVSVDDGGAVWLGGEGWIERRDRTGRRFDAWHDKDRLGRITSIATFENEVVVADTRDRRLRRFSRTGRFLNEIGADNNTKGFVIPNGHLDLDIDEKGVIYVNDPGKHRVERYDLDGRMLGRFGHFGMRKAEDFPGCCNPTNLALMPGERIVVSDKAPARVKIYTRKGRFLAVIGPEPFDQLGRNLDLAADARANLFVADPMALKVYVFEPEDAVAATQPVDAPSMATTKESASHE